MKRVFIALLMACIGTGAFAQSGLDITGKVVRYVESDEMVLQTSISAVESTVAEAFQEGNRKSRAVLSYLEGLEDVCEVQTQYIRLNEKWDYNNGNRRRVGFEAQQMITLRIRDFDQYPVIMARLIELGVDGISQVQFVYSKADEIREELRLEAIMAAKAKAETIAAALGVHVGAAEHYTEGSYAPPVFANMEYKMMSMTGEADAGPVISPAKSKIEMEVHVRFAILAPQE